MTREKLSQRADDLRKFLAATQKGYEYAAEHPEEAAQMVLTASLRQYPELADKLPSELLIKSQVHQSANYLGPSGRWGPLEIDRCKGFVDWLGDKGLLTTWKQSRNPDGATTGSLDDLRSGKVGEPVAREEYKDARMFDNCLWE